MGEESAALGRYVLHGEIASGGMATVHLGRLCAPGGFSRTVAVKRLHSHLAKDPDFVTMFLDEARLASRIRHPNVVSTIDVVTHRGEVFLVMDYVHGESLSKLWRGAFAENRRVPVSIACAVVDGVLAGLHAAHEATTDQGEPLGMVHRDVSPQNVLVGTDGVARLLDFGVAKAASRCQSTQDGRLKGKLSYMAPEQVRLQTLDRRSDLFAASVVLWELLTGRRLFDTPEPGATVAKILWEPILPPSAHAPDISPALDAVVMSGLERDPELRFATAREMAGALEAAAPAANARTVGEWVEAAAASSLRVRAQKVAEVESGVVASVGEWARSGEEVVTSSESATDISASLAFDPASDRSALGTARHTRRHALNAWVVGAVVLLAVAGAAAFGIARRASRPQAAAQAPLSTPASESDVPSALPSAESASSIKPPASESSVAAESTQRATPTHASAPPSNGAAVHNRHAPGALTPGVSSGPSGAQCQPKFYFDERGIKYFKPECLQVR